MYLNKPAESVGRPAIVAKLDALSRNGRAAMAATVSYGRAAYGRALKRGVVDANPFSNLGVKENNDRVRNLRNAAA